MKKIVISLAKKYILKNLNDTLSEYKNNVQKVTDAIRLWSERLAKIIESLNKLNDRVSDGTLDDSELEDTVKDIETLVKEF